MVRIVLALLLALTLWPSSAGASGGVPAREHRDEIRSLSPALTAAAMGSAGGVELLRGMESRCSGGCLRGCTHRSGPAPAGRPRPVGWHLAAPLAHVRDCAGGRDVDPAAVPLCERLPYHATAPPSWR